MAIPDFQTIMLPLLKRFSDGEPKVTRDLVDSIADDFQLTEDERARLIPSGGQSVIRNRIGWAQSHMTKAGLVERVGWGEYRITDRGRKVLAENPDRIDLKLLSQFPEHREFRKPKNSESVEHNSAYSAGTTDATPQEVIDASYQEIRKALADELLSVVKSSSPQFFEKLVVDLLVEMGYGGSRSDAAQAVGRAGDGGIDGIIKEDRLGLDAVYIQAKRWDGVVGRPVVQGFAGSLEGHRARKGVMITTSEFSRSAREYVGMIEKRIVLIDGEQLAQLMIDYGIGVSEVASYKVFRVDSDFFSEE
jgi:restriction system protein